MNPTDIPTAVSPAETAQLQELAGDGLVLELGAHLGYSTITLARVARTVHSVDWHGGDSMTGFASSLAAYCANLQRHAASNVVTHVGRFEDVLPLFRWDTFDGVFLDGEHDRASVRRDTELMWPLVKVGGWVAWHDWGRFEVAEAVSDWLRARDLGEPHVIEHLAWMRR